MKTTVVGVDIAKRVFQLHWVEPETGEIVTLQLKREKFLEHFANRASCVIGMEACGGSQHWARSLQKLGHQVKLLSARMVKPFVVGNKNDVADARGIWTAMQQPGIKGGGAQERSAASGVGTASDARAVGEVSHRADQRSAGVGDGIR
jgi:transposase